VALEKISEGLARQRFSGNKPGKQPTRTIYGQERATARRCRELVKECRDPRWDEERLTSNLEIGVVAGGVDIRGCELTNLSESQPVQQGEGAGGACLQRQARSS